MTLRLLPLLVFLPGCGLIAGLRTDYELADGSIGEASTEASVAEGGSEAGSDAGSDAGPDTGCTNMIKDGLETDTDCGGGICAKCGNNKNCKDASDCQSDNCNSSGKCRP